MTIESEWSILLIETAIAKDSHWIGCGGHGLRIKEVDSILASGLLIRTISILSEGLKHYIAANNIPLRNKEYATLKKRLKAMKSAGHLKNYDDLDHWRLRRNDVGHKLSDIYSWDELDKCQKDVFAALSEVKILKDFPNLTVTQVDARQPQREGGPSIEMKSTVQVHDGDKVYYEFGWTAATQK